jgi:hypothetical protein
MYAFNLFSGRQTFPALRLEWNKGKTVLSCAAWEEWRLIPPSPLVLSCGSERTEKMTRRYGITRTERSELEATVSGSLGVKGIAGIESAIKSGMGTEISLEAGEETESTFRFTAPPNGRRIVLLYQLTHGLHMSFEDRRFWHRDAWERTLIAWLPPVFDASKVEPVHPSCGGDVDPDRQSSGIAVQLISDTVGKLGVQWSDSKDIQFADQDTVLNQYFSFDAEGAKAVLSGGELPDYLRFLCRIDELELVTFNAWQQDVPALSEAAREQNTARVIPMEQDDLAVAGDNEVSMWAVT